MVNAGRRIKYTRSQFIIFRHQSSSVRRQTVFNISECTVTLFQKSKRSHLCYTRIAFAHIQQPLILIIKVKNMVGRHIQKIFGKKERCAEIIGRTVCSLATEFILFLIEKQCYSVTTRYKRSRFVTFTIVYGIPRTIGIHRIGKEVVDRISVMQIPISLSVIIFHIYIYMRFYTTTCRKIPHFHLLRNNRLPSRYIFLMKRRTVLH